MSRSRSSSLSMASSSTAQSIITTTSEDSIDIHKPRSIKRTRLNDSDSETDWARPSKRGFPPPDTNDTKLKSEGEDGNEEEEEDETVYEVEAIRGIRNLNITAPVEFSVKWKNYPETANTWEPLENLSGCMRLVCKFLMHMGSQMVPEAPMISGALSASSFPAILTPALQAFQDVFKDSTGHKITVENTVDDAGAPKGFTYINKQIYGKDVPIPDPAFLMSCSCGPNGCDINNPNKCECLRESIIANEWGVVPFEPDGRVVEAAGMMLWVCNPGCGCGPGCISKAAERGGKAALKIKRVADKGWGVFLDQDEPIPPRTFVSRYVGEVITNAEANRRGKYYDRTGATYLFDMDYNNEKKAVYAVDAYKVGNESHFLNHSCDPNLSVYVLQGEYGDDKLATLTFWSNRTIYKGDELTFDYDGQFIPPWMPKEERPKSSPHGRKPSKSYSTRCLCKAEKCRQWMHT
ncbi:hypothetical protein CPB97_012233 [Podila verticillata]|nr:hypothetical protein CPB97_012233 [Podila verticillata]